MIFVWVFGISLLLYIYYSVRVTAQLMALQSPDYAVARAVTGGGSTSLPPVPSVTDEPPPGAAVDEDVDHDYIDMEALTARSHIRTAPEIPVVHMERTAEAYYMGGAAGGHPNMEVGGGIDLAVESFKRGDRRTVKRRFEDRRANAAPEYGEDTHELGRRLSQRRVWLRREADQREHELVDIHEAAHILSTSPEMIEKWILTADLPFYMVSQGARREKRFDRIELLGWLGAEDVIEARARQSAQEVKDESA